jgi:hypothetical protein
MRPLRMVDERAEHQHRDEHCRDERAVVSQAFDRRSGRRDIRCQRWRGSGWR